MIKKRYTVLSILLLTLLLCLPGCSGSRQTDGFKSEVIDGVTHVYNSSVPLKGTVTLEVEEVLRIDSGSVNDGNSSFGRFIYDDEGNVYIGDPKNVRIYKFDKKGKLLLTLLQKGEGPGEFPSLPSFSLLGNDIWAVHTRHRKMARFDGSGNLMEERKLTKAGHGYSFVEIVDENRFVANYDRYEGEGKEKTRIHVFGMMDKDENTLTSLYEAPGIGYTEVKSEHVNTAFILPVISPVLLHHYDHGNKTIHLVLTSNYEIFIKDLDGHTRRVIHREHLPIMMTPAIRDEIMGLPMFKGGHPLLLKAVRDCLPQKLSVIQRFRFLGGGALAVYRFTGLSSSEIDIFDGDGRFIYTIKSSPRFPDPGKLNFCKGGFGVIGRSDEADVYTFYRVANLPGVMNQ